jgi:hypothetical protein
LLVVLLVLLVVTIKLILPSPQIFEGSLTVQEMSFTSTQENQTLLKNIYGISQISVQGIQTPPKGLEVRFSGEAQKIQVDLDSLFPVASIQAGFLTGKLPSDIVTFLISGLASIIITLLTWLLSNFST